MRYCQQAVEATDEKKQETKLRIVLKQKREVCCIFLPQNADLLLFCAPPLPFDVQSYPLMFFHPPSSKRLFIVFLSLNKLALKWINRSFRVNVYLHLNKSVYLRFRPKADFTARLHNSSPWKQLLSLSFGPSVVCRFKSLAAPFLG